MHEPGIRVYHKVYTAGVVEESALNKKMYIEWVKIESFQIFDFKMKNTFFSFHIR